MDLPNELLEWFLSAQATLVTKSENEVRQLIFNEEHYPAKAYKSGDLNLLNWLLRGTSRFWMILLQDEAN